MLASALPKVHVCLEPKSHWQHRLGTSVSLIEKASSIIAQPDQLDSSRFFKREERRLIFRLDHGGMDYAVKAMPLHRLRTRLAFKRYAYAEALNLLRAEKLGLPVPNVDAYGEARHWRLVRWNAVIMEYLPHIPLRERLISQPPEDEQWTLLLRALDVLVKLYHCGCNHIDFGPHAVMLGPEGPSGDTLLDLQYCHFYPNPRPETLAAQAGYFAWSVSTNRDWVSESMMARWFDHLLQVTELTVQKPKLLPIYDRARQKRASIRERLAQ